ncbi:MAG: glycoside hydrolase family 78 protein [Bacteroidota bacterium]|nr:glycoside hydrolase family 78 protein [Bacteroidota bacterium]
MFFIFGVICPFIFSSCVQKEPALAVANLRCAFLTDPLGIDNTNPDLSWEISGKGRGIMQTAYRVLVASSLEKLEKEDADLWDSKKINTDSSLGIRYSGKPLDSRTDCYWKVKIWVGDQLESDWSRPAHWSMGLLKPADWSAHWIGLDTFLLNDRPHDVHTRLSARYFRKEFSSDRKIKQASLYISGLGLYELYLNGQKLGDQVLAPAPTEYDKRVFYNSFDVTDKIQAGANAIGTVLGNGRFFTMRSGPSDIPTISNFGYPKMLLQLEIHYEDGTTQNISSDSTWKLTTAGPILTNNEFDGENYDANKEMKGWASTGFNESHWMPVQLVTPPTDNIVSQMNPPIRIMDSLKPISVSEVSPGKYIFDMGQNMVGWENLQIQNGKKGDTVTLRFAETLKSDGNLYTANLRGAEVTDRYVMKEGSQQWEPHFTYHGFRFVEITGFPGKPELADLTGKVVYDALETTGQFETSAPMINQIYHNAYWSIRGNYRGMPTDCPQRDERMGWLGDRAVGSYGESFLFDNNTLYAKWLQDIEDVQREDGSIPDVAPAYWKFYSDNMTWPGTYIIISNMLYHQFGNIKPIEKHYASMKKWMNYMRDKYVKADIMTKDNYGDWCMPPENQKLIHSEDPARQTAGDYLGTSYYYYFLQLMSRFAHLTGNTADEKEWNALAVKTKEAFNRKFLNTMNWEYSNNTATANIFALAYHLTPDSVRSKVFQHIVDKTMNDFKGHISTGLVGAQWLMRTLSHNGRADIAYHLATDTTYPSWGYMVKNGATTIWELWNGNTADPAMNSGNHVMLLGDLLVWFYEDLAGIKSDSIETGFKKIVMRPVPVNGLSHVKASYHSVHGLISSEWKTENEIFDWNITVPANTTALVAVPAKDADGVTESGKKAADSEGVKFLRMEGDRAVFETGSGAYDFVSKNFRSKEF